MAFAVTQNAAVALKRMLDQAEREPDQVFRLARGAQAKLIVTLDTQHEGDQVIEHLGSTLLVLEPSVQEFLADRTLDVMNLFSQARI